MGKFSKYLNNGKPFKSTSLWGMALEHEESKKGKRGRKRRKRLNNEDKPNTWPSREIRREMAKVIELDKQDAFREYGGVFGKYNDDQEKVLWAKPGPKCELGHGNRCKINRWDRANPREKSLYTYYGGFHSHPSAKKSDYDDLPPGTYQIGGGNHIFEQKPSVEDYKAEAKKDLVIIGNSFLFACGTKIVYEYNANGIVNEYSFNQFITL